MGNKSGKEGDSKSESKSESKGDAKESDTWAKLVKGDRKTNVKAIFDAIDVDKSGGIVAEEMKRFAAAIKQDDSLSTLMAMADLNKDGTVSIDEFSKFLENLLRAAFAKVDANNDGTISKAELATLLSIMANSGVRPSMLKVLRLTIEKHLGDDAGKTDFAKFCDVAIGLLANSVQCKEKEIQAGSKDQVLPQPVINLLMFSTSAAQWEKLTGVSLKDAAAADEKEAKEKDMQKRIEEAMQAAIKAEQEAKERQAAAEEERRRAEAQAAMTFDHFPQVIPDEPFIPDQYMYAVAEKPVVYVYSPQPADVTVSCQFAAGQWSNLVSYPKLEPQTISDSKSASVHSWTVRTGGAKAGSSVTDTKTGRFVPYLFYEATSAKPLALKAEECHCVARSEIESFLPMALGRFGLVGKEVDDACMYWLARMRKSEFVLLRFATEEFAKDVALTSSPAADALLRVFFVWRGVSERVSGVRPAPLPAAAPKRSEEQLTLVEWGGAEL